MSLSIGIDLGTTNSVVSLFKDGQLFFGSDIYGQKTIPSVVCYAEDTHFVGREALEIEDDYPETTIRSSKRTIAAPHDLIDNVNAIDVAEDILRYLKTVAENTFKEPVENLVITVPAYFSHNARLNTRTATERAGFKVLRMINEPTAAALAYGENSKLNEKVLIYDLGGGTFDVTLLTMSDTMVYQVLATSGNTSLGGDDFDRMIFQDFITQLPEDFKPFSDFKVRLKKFAEEIKIKLNYKDKVSQILKYCGTTSGGKLYHHNYSITQEKYKELIAPSLKETANHVLDVLLESNVKVQDLSKIILVGGSTKSKFVREYVENNFNVKVYYDIDPDMTVAAGAAILADSLTSFKSDTTLLIDVTPLSLGIETKGGLMSKIIPRNTSIPVKESQQFKTAFDDQDLVVIKIFQGERPLAESNELLGEFHLTDIPRRPKGQTKIIVTFDIDSSGLIHVSAIDKETGKSSSVTVQPLTTDQINKYYDREEESSQYEKEKLEIIEKNKLIDIIASEIAFKRMKQEPATELEEQLEEAKDNLLALRVIAKSIEGIV